MKYPKDSRLPIGNSDPVCFTCTCDASASGGGLVLLFYRYFAAPPSLTLTNPQEISELATFHTNLTGKLNLGGKIRVGNEGFNVTVGGTKDAIKQYIAACLTHWSFSGLSLTAPSLRNEFFKPTPGCACAFNSICSVRITAEITPMGVTNYVPANWDVIESLSPTDFHARCLEDGKKVLVDVRNHYESRIGHFVDPVSGEKAITPEIRRFSQWPQYVKTHMSEFDGEGKRDIMTYCTGGIRCEKGVRFLAEKMDFEGRDRICTLKGGIAAYLMWMDEEIKAGRKMADESLFWGKNYVFDARGSMGLVEDGDAEPVSSCHICGVPSDRLSKCRSQGCHLILVVCPACEDSGDPRCCEDCEALDAGNDVSEKIREGPRPICHCEREREAQLWGGKSVRQPKTQGWRKEKRTPGNDTINVQISIFD